MTTRRVEGVAREIGPLLALGAASGLADGQLLGRFEGGDDGASRLAFEALVERHGPMVLRVCRGVLRDPHDAQDAFQATFLVLARRAGSIRGRDSLASWLHGVALRVSRHARAREARRRRLERAAATQIESRTRDDAGDDLIPRLLEEVGRLPERYRAAVVLCHLEGHTCEDAARILRWPVGTVKSRLSRARDRLKARLTRLGLAPALPSVVTTAPLPPRLAKATARLAARLGAGSSPPASSLVAVALAEGVLKVMTLSKWKPLAVALLLSATGLGVASALATPRAPQEPPRKVEARPKAEEEPPAPPPDPMALTTPRHLEAHAGRGEALVYALDDRGDRIAVAENGPWAEVVTPLRWVAVTGVVDNQAVRGALALKRGVGLPEAVADYKRLDVERQVRRPGGDWSDWTRPDQNKNYEVLDNLPEVSAERLPEEVRPSALVDPLPFLKEGVWDGVDPKPLLGPAGVGEVGVRPLAVRPAPKPTPGRRLESPGLAIRSLDFTVEAGAAYRYRLRVVVVNPDPTRDKRGRIVEKEPFGDRRRLAVDEDGEDQRGRIVDKELFGPWSEPTEEAAVP